MQGKLPSGHLAIPCSNFGEATPGTDGEPATDIFTHMSARSSSQRATEADRGQASVACQDTGESYHETLDRFMDQAADDAIT
eukprot:1007486-Pyramimonas_sp.AAC.1